MYQLQANALLRLIIRPQGHIVIGSDSTVNWWRLRNCNGNVNIGCNSIIQCRIDFDSPHGQVLIGSRCFLGASHLICHTGITIGDDVIISWGTTIVDHDSHSVIWKERQHDVEDWKTGKKQWDMVNIAPVKIRDKVWIGFGASILKGVTVGEGAVIGAGSVVTKDVPPYTIVAGNPARVIRELTEDER